MVINKERKVRNFLRDYRTFVVVLNDEIKQQSSEEKKETCREDEEMEEKRNEGKRTRWNEDKNHFM